MSAPQRPHSRSAYMFTFQQCGHTSKDPCEFAIITVPVSVPVPVPVRSSFPRTLPNVSTRKNARHEREHIRSAYITIAVFPNEPALYDVDLLLRILVEHAGDEARELDGVLLILEELELECLLKARVRVIPETFAVDRE